MAGLNVPITVEATQAKQELGAFNAEMRKVEEIYRLTEKEMQAMGNATGKLQAEFEALNKKVDLQASIIEKQKTILAASRKEVDEKRLAMEKANTEYERGKTAYADNETELLKLEKALASANKEFESAERRVSAWANELQKSEIKKRTFEANLQSIERELSGVRVAAEKSEGSFVQMAAAMGTANIAVNAITAALSNVSNYLSQGAKMAEQFAQAQGQLELVMRNTMGATAEQVEAIHELTMAQQQLGVVSQTAQLAGAQQLAINIQNKESLQALVPVMNDLVAQQYGINATSQNTTQIAAQMTRVLGGNVRAMERMGFAFTEAQAEIMKTGDETQRVATLIEVITASVGGMNEALAQTDVGRQAQLNNVLAETQQRIGEVWNSLRAEASAEMLPALEEIFTNLLRLVEENRDNISALMGVLSGLVSFIVDNQRAVVGAFITIGGAIAAMKISAAVTGLQEWIVALKASVVTGQSAAVAKKQLAAARTTDATTTQIQTAATIKGNAALAAKTVTVKALTAAMMANPLFAAVGAGLAITGIIFAVDRLSGSTERLTEDIDHLADRARKLADEYNRTQREINDIESEMEAVQRRMARLHEMGPLTIVEQEELAALMLLNDELIRNARIQEAAAHQVILERDEAAIAFLTERNGLLERGIGLITAYHNGVRMIANEYGDWRDTVPRPAQSDIRQRLLELDAEITEQRNLILGIADGYEDAVRAVEKFRDALDELVDTWDEEAARQLNSRRETNETAAQTLNAAQLTQRALAELTLAYRDGEISGREYSDALREMLAEIEALTRANPHLTREFTALGEEIQEQLSRSPEHLDNLRRSTTSLTREVDLLRGALDEQNEAGELSVNTILRLIENNYASALSYDAETGAIRLNTEAMADLARERIQNQIIQAETAKLNLVTRLEEEERATLRVGAAVNVLGITLLETTRARQLAAAATREEIAALEQQINVLNRLRDNLTTPQIRPRGNNAARDAEREAENARRERVAAWEAHYREREELSRNWIDRRNFYNDLSAEREIRANERVLEYLRGYLDEVNDLYFATDEERARIRRDILQRIERYERAHWTAQRRLVQESEVDNARAERTRMDALQRDIDRAENDVERYRVLGQKREELTAQMYAALDEISNRFWLNEREKLHAMEDAHRDHKRNIERIEGQMHDLRLRRLNEQAAAWRTVETDQLDETRRRLDAQAQAQRDALNRELDALREHFAALDAEERRWDRSNDLAALRRDAEVWQDAATQTGRERFENIQRQIENLQRQEEREIRNLHRQQAETSIRGQIEAVDRNHARQMESLERQRVAIQEKYEAMRNAATRLAGETQIGLMEAGEALTEGLHNMYEEFDKVIDRLTTNQVVKIQNMAAAIQTILSQIQTSFARIGSLGGGTNITNNSRSMTLNSTTNIYGNDQPAMAQAWHETRDIMFRGANLRV